MIPQINGLGRNINQLRRKLPDSNKSLAKRLKKLVKAWQQLIQRQTPNGLSAPSLAGAAGAPTITANNKPEQSSANDEQQPQQSNVAESRQRRKSISSSSREGTPSRSSMTMIGESLASKSSHPPPPPIATATATAGGGTPHLQTNASRTPTPTPSPHPPPPATPTSSSLSTSSAPQVPPVPSSVAGSTPQTAAVIPRPTKAQDFARNRIRRMQMLAQVTPQSHKPVVATPQAPFPAATAAAMSTTTSSMSNEQQPKSQEANASQQQWQSGGEISQSLASQQQLPPPVTGTESFHNASSVKGTGLVSQSDHSLATSSPVLNGSHFKAAAGMMAAVSDSKSSSKSSLSSSSNKFIGAHSRSTPSLSQIVTNSFNHDPPPPPPPPPPSSYLAESHFSSIPPISTSTSASLSTTIAHKVGVKGSQERGTSSQERLTEMPSPPEESLLVQIPRNLVHISRRNHEFREAKGLHHRTDRQGLSSDLEEFSLTVSIDLSLLHQFSNSQQVIGGSLEDIKRNRTEWFVKEGHRIPENSLHKFGDASEPMETETITSFGSGGISRVPMFASSGHFTAFGGGMGIPHLPTSGPRLVPSGASPGVDGCMGSDGYWYSWTDSIPGHDVSVTVLPYIYVDDDESDAMEVFTN